MLLGDQGHKDLEEMNAYCHTAFSAAALVHVLGLEYEDKILGDLAHLEATAIISKHCSVDDVDATIAKYRTSYKGCMKRLREKLCDGRPGPTMGMIIAILGLKESRKRLALRYTT